VRVVLVGLHSVNEAGADPCMLRMVSGTTAAASNTSVTSRINRLSNAESTDIFVAPRIPLRTTPSMLPQLAEASGGSCKRGSTGPAQEPRACRALILPVCQTLLVVYRSEQAACRIGPLRSLPTILKILAFGRHFSRDPGLTLRRTRANHIPR
jgi:hypothetical protein